MLKAPPPVKEWGEMTKTFDIRGQNKFQPGPAGLGQAVVQGKLTMVPTREAIHCSDVNLNSIKSVLIEQNTNGSLIFVSVIAPGSYDNYASLKSYDLAGTNRLRAAGTLSANFFAIGN